MPSEDLEISQAELVQRRGDPTLVLVDALPRAAYDSLHIAGAISLPVADVPSRAASLLPDRAQEIATYCGGPT